MSKSNLIDAQQRMKTLSNIDKTKMILRERHLVFTKLEPYKQVSITQCHHKLSKRYYGHYKIIKRIGSIAYEVKLCDNLPLY